MAAFAAMACMNRICNRRYWEHQQCGPSKILPSRPSHESSDGIFSRNHDVKAPALATRSAGDARVCWNGAPR